MPTLRTVNKAITRRFNRIPFAVTIPDAQVNVHFAEELKAEWPGILAWAIKGCLEWQRIGLAPPKAVTDATESYLESEDVLGAWLDERCELNANAWESSADLYRSWKDWAEEQQAWIGSAKDLTQRLEDRGGFRRAKNKDKTARGFYGLRLNASESKRIKGTPKATTAEGKGHGMRFG
jgi:putative DNA primase/helicase